MELHLMTPFLAAGIETIIGLLLFLAISALSSWLKHRQEGKEQAPPRPQPRPAEEKEGPRRAVSNWEEELRRLLEGEEAKAPPTPPPIVVYQPQPVPPPLPPGGIFPQPVARQAEEGEGGWEEISAPTRASALIESAGHLEDRVEERLRQRRALAQASTRISHASHLEAAVAERLRQISASGPTALPTTALTTRPPSREAVEMLTGLRRPGGVRSAFVASLIFGQPKSLEG